MDWKIIIITSATTSAIVTGLVTVVTNWMNERAQNNRQYLEMAMKLTELRHGQIRMLLKMHEQDGKKLPRITMNDPAVIMSKYLKAVKEISSVGVWAEGEEMKRTYERKVSK